MTKFECGNIVVRIQSFAEGSWVPKGALGVVLGQSRSKPDSYHVTWMFPVMTPGKNRVLIRAPNVISSGAKMVRLTEASEEQLVLENQTEIAAMISVEVDGPRDAREVN